MRTRWVRGDFEPFEPAVQRSDIRLESPIAATILIDPESGQPLRAPVGEDITLTMDQIKKLGLTRWHQPHRRSR